MESVMHAMQMRVPMLSLVGQHAWQSAGLHGEQWQGGFAGWLEAVV